MENQHRKITGYRELSQEEIDTMNAIKEFEVVADALVAKLGLLPKGVVTARWLGAGTTALRTGVVLLKRAVRMETIA